MEVQKTALYNYHKNLGAKFVPFAGYEMPIQYKDGIVKEHISTRTHAGFFDVSHMGQFFLEGDETLIESLEKIIPADLKNLKVNHSKYSFLLNNEGGIIDDLIITRTEKGFCIILNAACKENDIKQISQFLKKNHKHLLNNDLSLIALQGPKSVEILEKLIPGVANLKFMTGNNFDYEGENLYVTRSGYTGEDGFEISISNTKVEKLIDYLISNEVKPIGLGARDTLRLEAGLCLYGHDLNEKINPVEANLKWAIAKKRREVGGFNGWEKIKNLLVNGSEKIRVGIKPDGKVIARENTKIFSSDNNEIGLSNGDIGVLIGLKNKRKYLFRKFNDNNEEIVALIDPSNLENVVPAIAITIHKSQGSESEKVSILWSQKFRRNKNAVKEKKDNQNIFCRDNFERRLLYTAVTRAKKFLDIYYLN